MAFEHYRRRKLLGLLEPELADAFGIAGASDNPLYITWCGDGGMWKGVAYSYMTYNAVHVCWMAYNGLTGPSKELH